MNNNNKQKVKDILAKYNLRTIKRDNNVSSIQLNEKKTKISSPPVTYTIPNPKNIIKITPEHNVPTTPVQNNKIEEKPISIQKIIDNDRTNAELLDKKMKNTMPTAVIPNNIKIKPNIYDFIPTVKEPITEKKLINNNIQQQQTITKIKPEEKIKSISMITPSIKNNLTTKNISMGLPQKNNISSNKKINPLLIIPQINNSIDIINDKNKEKKPIELKQVFIDEKLNEDQSQNYTGLKNTSIKEQQPQINITSRSIIEQQPTFKNNNDTSNNDAIRILERKRLELIKMQNEELQKLKLKKEQITKLSNQKKEQALLKSIELEKQKLAKIHQQKQKVTNLLQQNLIPLTIPVQTPVQTPIKNIIKTNIKNQVKQISSYDKINNLNVNSIFQKKNEINPSVIEPVILNNNENIKPTEPIPIQTDKKIKSNIKTIEQYTYYTKKDFPNLKWNNDNLYTNTLQFTNCIPYCKNLPNNNKISQDEQFNLLKSTYGFKHLDKLKETDKIKLPKLYNTLYNILFNENFLKIKLCT